MGEVISMIKNATEKEIEEMKLVLKKLIEKLNSI